MKPHGLFIHVVTPNGTHGNWRHVFKKSTSAEWRNFDLNNFEIALLWNKAEKRADFKILEPLGGFPYFSSQTYHQIYIYRAFFIFCSLLINSCFLIYFISINTFFFSPFYAKFMFLIINGTPHTFPFLELQFHFIILYYKRINNL